MIIIFKNFNINKINKKITYLKYFHFELKPFLETYKKLFLLFIYYKINTKYKLN